MLLILSFLIAGEIPIPNKAQLAWSEAELGVVFHYDLHVFDGVKYGQGGNRILPVPDYNIFNPEKLDTDQWIKAAKAMGATFAILTATHETGFALFQSDYNPYCLKAVKWRGGKADIVKDFVNSCRKYGIKPGIYLGIRWNSFFGVHDFVVNGTGEFQKNRQKYYNQMVEGMLTEICTNYGDLFEIWFDGGASHPDKGAPDVLPIVKKYQPNCLFYHNEQLAEARWGGSESGTVPYPCWATFPNFYSHAGDTPVDHIKLLKHGDPNGKYWMPAMSDAPLRGYNGRHEWFWEPGDEDHIYTVDDLMNMYNKSVGHNSTLILGLTPDPDGLMPEPDVKIMTEFGNKLEQLYGNPRGKTDGTGKRYELKFNKETTLSHIIIQEDISKGQRIRKYIIEAKNGNGWKKIAEGSSIGNKRIQYFDSPVTCKKLRLVIEKSVDKPLITNFSAFSLQNENIAKDNNDNSSEESFPMSELESHLTNAQMVNTETGYHLWGSSPIIGEDGKVHLFTARWPSKKGARVNGFTPYWKIDGEVAHYVGDSETGPFHFSDIAARTESGNFFSPHNPNIRKIGDQYVLVFIVNNGGDLGEQRIIMYLSESVYGPWRPSKNGTREDGTVLERPIDQGIWCNSSNKGVTNPSLIEAEGKFYIFYKSSAIDKENPNKHAFSNYGVAVAKHIEGPYKHFEKPITDPKKSIEDAYAFFVDGKFYLATTDHLNHFKTSPSGHYSQAGVVLWQSSDPFHFPVEDVTLAVGPISKYVDKSILDNSLKYRGIKFERPQFLLNDKGVPVRFYAPVGFNPVGGSGTAVYTLEVK